MSPRTFRVKLLVGLRRCLLLTIAQVAEGVGGALRVQPATRRLDYLRLVHVHVRLLLLILRLLAVAIRATLFSLRNAQLAVLHAWRDHRIAMLLNNWRKEHLLFFTLLLLHQQSAQEVVVLVIHVAVSTITTRTG